MDRKGKAGRRAANVRRNIFRRIIISETTSTKACINTVSPPNVFLSTMGTNMGTKGRAVPRVVCCAIPISRAAGKVLVVTSRKRPNRWVCESLRAGHSDVVTHVFFSLRRV
jgi:hypothetical protein